MKLCSGAGSFYPSSLLSLEIFPRKNTCFCFYLAESIPPILMDWRAPVSSHDGCLHVWFQWSYLLSHTHNWLCLFFRLPKYAYGLLRFLLIIINNLYCIPTHCLWLLTLWPLQWFLPKVYLTLEGFGFQFLLSMVSAWSYTAGYEGESLSFVLPF